MNEQERFVFDTQGCLVVPDILSRREVDRLVRAFPRDNEGAVLLEAPDDNSHHDILNWEDPLFRELINHPGVLPYFEALLTDPEGDYPGHQTIILEHEYTMYLRPGVPGPTFHNGGTPHDPWYSYTVRDGKILCTLLTVVWLLNDVAEDDGGFWYIPGSHKANFPMPPGLDDYSWIPDCATQPVAGAGSAIIFTEALVHGTRPWQAGEDRYVLLSGGRAPCPRELEHRDVSRPAADPWASRPRENRVASIGSAGCGSSGISGSGHDPWPRADCPPCARVHCHDAREIQAEPELPQSL